MQFKHTSNKQPSAHDAGRAPVISVISVAHLLCTCKAERGCVIVLLANPDYCRPFLSLIKGLLGYQPRHQNQYIILANSATQ